MKRRAARGIEVFSMSAIDLFAAAMGAFALLAIILLPYYQNEIRENTPDNAIADLLRAAEDSQIETVEKKKALQTKRSAMAKNVSDIKSDETKLLEELRAAEAALREKQAAAIPRVVPIPEPAPVDPRPAPTPEKATVSFRFLGMKTAKDDVVIALDMNRCLGGHEESVKIFLVSDGLPNPRANNGLSPSRLAGEITRMNAGRKEIHTVVVGNYFDYDGTVEFMESISRANRGQFMALASARSGICD